MIKMGQFEITGSKQWVSSGVYYAKNHENGDKKIRRNMTRLALITPLAFQKLGIKFIGALLAILLPKTSGPKFQLSNFNHHKFTYFS